MLNNVIILYRYIGNKIGYKNSKTTKANTALDINHPLLKRQKTPEFSDKNELI